MTRGQKLIVAGVFVAIILLLAFRKSTVTRVDGGLNIGGGSGSPITDEGLLFEPEWFNWSGDDCACDIVILDPPDIFIPPAYFGQAAAFVRPKPDIPEIIQLAPLPPPVAANPVVLPPPPVYPAPVVQAPKLTYRAVTLRTGDAWITNKGPGKVPKGGALGFRLSDGRNLAIGLNNRPYVQEDVWNANSTILFGGSRWYRSDPV